MMKLNRMFACAMSFVMLMSFCACGGSDETDEEMDQIVAQKVTIVTGDDKPEIEDMSDETTAKVTVSATVSENKTESITTPAITTVSSEKAVTTSATTKKNQTTTKKNNSSNSVGNSNSGGNYAGNSGGSSNNSSGGNSSSVKTTAAIATTTTTTTTTVTTTTTTEYIAPEDVDKYIDFAVIGDGDGYTYDGITLNIFSAGTYHLTGQLEEGQIYINVSNEEKVKLRLNGIGIRKTGAPCIQVDNADKVTINVIDGSSNYLECYSTNAEADAAVYSKDDLKIKGRGYLYVFCDNEHGVACNNDLEIEECQLEVDAEKNGISSHKSILISSGTITANGDNCGIRSWDSIEIADGFVTACGGKKSESDRGGIISDTGNFYIGYGTVIAVGMNQTIPAGQTSAIFSFPTVITKDNIVGVSIDGMSLASATPNKKYSSVLISDPSLYIGGTLDVWLNDAHYDSIALTDQATQSVLDGVV